MPLFSVNLLQQVTRGISRNIMVIVSKYNLVENPHTGLFC